MEKAPITAFLGNVAQFGSNGYFRQNNAIDMTVHRLKLNYYEHVLSHPEDMPKDLTFQVILDLANYAFSRKTGLETTLIPEYNHETFSNLDGWE